MNKATEKVEFDIATTQQKHPLERAKSILSQMQHIVDDMQVVLQLKQCIEETNTLLLETLRDPVV